MRIDTFSVLCVTAGLALAVNRVVITQPATPPGDVITVNGCLTARPDGQSFALTPVKTPPVGDAINRAANDVRPTFTYELSGQTDQLRAHVGHLVTAKGRLETGDKKSADVEKQQKTTPPATGDRKPQVKVTERAEIEVRHLAVTSLTSEGKSCSTPKS